MTHSGAGWPRWLLVTLIVLAVIVLIPLGWMTCAMLFGGGMMGGMMGQGMMGNQMMPMHWGGLLGMAVLLVLLVALILLILRQLSSRSRDEPAPSQTPESPRRGPGEGPPR